MILGSLRAQPATPPSHRAQTTAHSAVGLNPGPCLIAKHSLQLCLIRSPDSDPTQSPSIARCPTQQENLGNNPAQPWSTVSRLTHCGIQREGSADQRAQPAILPNRGAQPVAYLMAKPQLWPCPTPGHSLQPCMIAEAPPEHRVQPSSTIWSGSTV